MTDASGTAPAPDPVDTASGTVGVAADVADHGAAPARAGRAPAPWRRPVLYIAAGALVLRLFLVLIAHPTCSFDAERWARGEVTLEDYNRLGAVDPTCFNIGGDALYMFLQGKLLAEGNGYASPPFYMINGVVSPGASKPPALPTLIAGLHVLGLDQPNDVRIMAAFFGAAAVVVIGHVAGRLAGKRAAVIAAVIAALYPMLWINDWKMLNDGPMALMTALVLLAAFHFWERPDRKTAAWLGAAIVAAAFMRSEALNLLLFLVVPLAFFLPGKAVKERVVLGAVAIGTSLAIFAPWAIYNAARFHQPNLAGGSLGSVMINASCDDAWYGESMGYLDFDCIDPLSRLRTAALADDTSGAKDESDAEVIFRERAFAYFGANERRFPIVAVARLGRMFDFYRPAQNLQFDINLEGRGTLDTWLGTIAYFVLLPFAVAGLFVCRRRRIPITPFVALVLSVSQTAVLSFGLTRFRVPVEVAIVILAALAVEAGLARYLDPRRAGTGEAPTPWHDVAAWRPTVPSTRTLAAVAVPVLALLLVLGWSAGATPGAPGPGSGGGGTTATTVTDDPACVIIRRYQLDDLNMYGTLSPDTIDPVIEGFEKLVDVAPPDLQQEAQDGARLLTQARDAGFTKGKLLDAFDRTERNQIVRAGLAVVEYGKTCG